MYQALSPKVLEEMSEVGMAVITVKEGWEGVGNWSSKPSWISYCLGHHTQEHIFSCYVTKENRVLQVSNIEATELIADKKCLVDAYLMVALLGLIDHGRMVGCKMLVIDTWLGCAIDHMLDLKFNIQKSMTFCSIRGHKNLEED